MDPRYSAQDVMRCDLCDTPVPPMYCDLCEVKLCKACVGEHISDLSIEHKVVPFIQRLSTPKCPKCSKHDKTCELHCEKCDVPVCVGCLSSNSHKGHAFLNVLEVLTSKSKKMEKDRKELEYDIVPKFEEVLSEFYVVKESSLEDCRKLTAAVTKQGEIWHREIDNIVNQLKTEIEEMKIKQLNTMEKHEAEIKTLISEAKQSALDLKKSLMSKDASLSLSYESKNTEFSRLCRLPDMKISLPDFSPPQINTEELRQLFGSLEDTTVPDIPPRKDKTASDVLRNSAGAPAKKGDTGKYYCGRWVLTCRCCDGYCGPDNGCNCKACRELDKNENIKQRKDTREVLRNSAGEPVRRGSTGKYYCGRRVLSCRCCDGQCGPDNGCNCKPCQQLDKKNARQRGVHVVSHGNGRVNRRGAVAKKGDTGKYYCGRKVLRCRCCDGYCGPDNGCNCEPCQELDLEEQFRGLVEIPDILHGFRRGTRFQRW
ncbi:E3 ubiquitin-protein ligase TRIM36-like isoform X2 [Ostrea edulis]|uniref:E3 ubiquitin-protein ligase TRIM36-like isoform X2 n=1 Tax=Ostrea edulis TaxID=37623 RepID=UPI0024AF4D24|nr:E3 ubiquitin-protein ligase TRIM36-like isoform X2 [Ostrea edulis]